ncbi:diacylglycerol kinase family enzyme [Actinoplanes lutulentus]|uniref:Diacylglycerol kinase family enzyme n=1 Tax=Actinoplanes lutulentus TaxID=1287878 RepID=A0A327ZAY7_9ACTN|nr:diacylglycerol kinase family protein [Actinoplanes lutulentus]MBB2941280.1 diacylglycerol kinase family enzyme [Actinoplanes lutulentus]RAK36772.1 diacylglycerol kinase family enzyme [Actinoplanes lutulentus]
MLESRSHRWLARLCFLGAAAAVLLVLTVAGVAASLLLVLTAAIGTAAGLAAAWWFLTHRGLLRWLAGAVVVVAPLVVAVLFARANLIWVVLVFGLLWAAAVAAGKRALAVPSTGDGVTSSFETAAPLRPYLIMNPRSGGGKVERYRLAERARALGAQVFLLEGPAVDVAEIAQRAIRDGADLLGVAGGDGTQALVAGIAAEHGVPFLVISAGTRNHFALDLGLDRENPAACLDALTDGVELTIDLGLIGDRTFVNNASFGAYAEIVRSPAYRDDKIGTTLELLPRVLADSDQRLELTVDGTTVTGPQAVLVSNNPYAADDIAGLGRRHRLDSGVLGVLAVTVRGAADAAGLISGKGRARSLTVRNTGRVVIDADAPAVPVGIDGEAVTMPTPVRCEIRPGALRVRVPRHRPGVPPPPPELDWSRLRRLALGSSPSSAPGEEKARPAAASSAV